MCAHSFSVVVLVYTAQRKPHSAPSVDWYFDVSEAARHTNTGALCESHTDHFGIHIRSPRSTWWCNHVCVFCVWPAGSYIGADKFNELEHTLGSRRRVYAISRSLVWFARCFAHAIRRECAHIHFTRLHI